MWGIEPKCETVAQHADHYAPAVPIIMLALLIFIDIMKCGTDVLIDWFLVALWSVFQMEIKIYFIDWFKGI